MPSLKRRAPRLATAAARDACSTTTTNNPPDSTRLRSLQARRIVARYALPWPVAFTVADLCFGKAR